MKKNNISYFDLRLFKRIMVYTKPYIKTYYVVLISAILLSLFSTLNPYLLKITVDDYITPRNYSGLMTFIFIMLIVLLLEVIFQYIFVFYANWLGQMVIKDIRVSLFKKLVSFKMNFFDKSAVGRLVTRSVSDIESIANIFSQGLFMILADFLKMGIVIIVMIVINFELSLVVFSILPRSPILIVRIVWSYNFQASPADKDPLLACGNTHPKQRIHFFETLIAGFHGK